MKTQFERIYETNEWQFGSGEGSLPEHTVAYRSLIEEFIRENNIQDVLDFGCGDWQSSQFIDWANVHYLGLDIVPSVIEVNRARFGKKNIEFNVFQEDLSHLPKADLLIVKDVLQHWSNASIFRFLPLLRRFRFCLLTNCVKWWGTTRNKDIADGAFRCLDLRVPPFNVAAEELLTFYNHRPIWQRFVTRPRWCKKVLLVRN